MTNQQLPPEDVLARFRLSQEKADSKLSGTSDARGRSIAVQVLTEVIMSQRPSKSKSQQSVPSPVEYFSGCFCVLESSSQGFSGIDAVSKKSSGSSILSKNFESVQHILFLLSQVLPSVNDSVILAKSEACLDILINILRNANLLDDTQLISKVDRACVACIAHFLLVIFVRSDKNAFSGEAVIKSVQVMLQSLSDHRPKLRKVGQKAVLDILNETENAKRQKNVQKLAELVCDLCNKVFLSVSNLSATDMDAEIRVKVLQLLHFLQLTTAPIAKCRKAPVLLSTIVGLTKSKNDDVTQHSLSTLGYFFKAEINLGVKSESLRKLVIQLMKLVDGAVLESNTSALESFADCFPKIFRKYCEVDETEATGLYEKLLLKLTSASQKSGNYVAQKMYLSTISKILKPLVSNNFAVSKTFATLDELVAPKKERQFSTVFDAISKVLQVCMESSKPAETSNELINLTQKLAKLKVVIDDREKLPKYHQPLAKVLQQIYSLIGPYEFNKIVPITELNESENEQIDLKKEFVFILMMKSLPETKMNCLPFFLQTLCPLAKMTLEQFKTLGLKEESNLRKNYLMQYMRIWSLFPFFCQTVQKTDENGNNFTIAELLSTVSDAFNAPLLEKEGLKSTLSRHLAGGLSKLGVALTTEDEQTKQQVESFAESLLEVLFKSYLENFSVGNDDGLSEFKDAILTLMPFASSEFCSKQFEQQLQSLKNSLENSMEIADDEGKDPKKETRAFCGLLSCTVSKLNNNDLNSIFDLVNKYLTTYGNDEIQKIGYKLLEGLLKSRRDFFMEKATEIMPVLLGTLGSKNAFVKLERLHCIDALLGSEDVSMELVSKVIGEIILSTKETNQKTRTRAFRMLVSLSHRFHAKGELVMFLNRVIAGLGARTSFMISATVNSLSAIIGCHSFTIKNLPLSDVLIKNLLSISRTALLLSHNRAREVIKSVLDFSKIIVSKLSRDQISELFDDIVGNLAIHANDSKNRFKVKVKIVFERLLKKFGQERFKESKAIANDTKFLKYLLKQENSKQNKLKRKADEDEIESNDEDDDAAGVKMQLDGRKTVDLLDKEQLSKLVQDIMNSGDVEEGKASNDDFVLDISDEDSDEDQDIIEFTETGQIKVTEANGGPTSSDKKRKRSTDMDLDDGDEDFEMDDSDVDSEDFRGGNLEEGEKAFGRRKNTREVVREMAKAKGKPATSANAGKKKKKIQVKKPKFEPFEYIQFDKKLMLNKRKKHEAKKKFTGIGRGKSSAKMSKKNK